MSLLQNQFTQSPVQGETDLKMSTGTLSCQIDVSEAGQLVPGQAVKQVDSVGGVPKVIACASDADVVFGFINYNIKNQVFKAGDAVEISMGMLTNVMYMTASGALSVQTPIMPVIASKKIVAASGGKPISGVTLDKALADGDLIRVMIATPALFHS